jgi:hypothetical protein
MNSAVCSTPESGLVRVIESRVDPFYGLKGHDYIKARNLAPQVQRRVQTSAQPVAAATREVCK